jgi:RNA polymerase sigma-70 factor (ECF subfamily)
VAWQGLPRFRGEARFPTWLSRITYHCCLRQLEQREREQARHSAMQVEQVLAGVNKEKQAAETIVRRELQANVREQLEHLPFDCTWLQSAANGYVAY